MIDDNNLFPLHAVHSWAPWRFPSWGRLISSPLMLATSSSRLSQWSLSLLCFAFTFIYWLLAALGLRGCTWVFSSCISRCAGFSLWWLLSLQSTGTRMLGLSSCGAQTWLLPGIWKLPGPGIEPVCPALAGRFLNSGPAMKSDPYPYVYASNKHVHNETDSWTVYFFKKQSFRLAPYYTVFLGFLTNLLTSVDTKLLPTVDSTFHSETRTIVPAYSV